MAFSRRRTNRINHVAVSDTAVTEDPEEIEARFLQFFEHKWLCDSPLLDGWPAFGEQSSIGSARAAELLMDITQGKFGRWLRTSSRTGRRVWMGCPPPSSRAFGI
ncbi:hypothetical protein KSP39_PZI004818 [Platanthera zijinensis]|uniref:Uncharacterized protein n=1 Tax=Platanthera zijinensis TaxID=2320716 RepID=A0AAP0GCA7_9ASPA